VNKNADAENGCQLYTHEAELVDINKLNQIETEAVALFALMMAFLIPFT
jgi:hypothetical protein